MDIAGNAHDILLNDAQIALRDTAARIANETLAERSEQWEMDESVNFEDLKRILMDVGFLGMTIPVEFGGSGATFLDFVIVMEQLSRVSNPAAFYIGATCSGPVSQVLHFGSQELKEEVLPQITKDGAICSIAMTESEAGSDVGAIRTRAVADGAGNLVVNGTKLYVGGAGIARYYVTYVRLGEEHGTAGLACLVIASDNPGIELGSQARMLGTRGIPRRELIFRDCVVAERYLLARPGQFKEMITIFNRERIHNAAMALGKATGAFEHARIYAQGRYQFGRPLADFQGTRWKLAQMATYLEACRWLVYSAAVAADRGEDVGMIASMAKWLTAEWGFQVSDMALQIEGAMGAHDGFIQTAFRNSRISRISAGSTEMMLNYIGANLAKLP